MNTAEIIIDEPFVMAVLDGGNMVPLATGHEWMPPLSLRDVEMARALLATALKQLDQAKQDIEMNRLMQLSGATTPQEPTP